ncbi:hypothetical protein PI124_g20024 [Phytophthora idaei]|nr:hypothetical protein PI124_g20024 [Phytophthora idaei]
MEASLTQARADRDKALVDRQQIESKLRDLVSAKTDFEHEVRRLKETVGAKRRRIRELKFDFEQRSARASSMITSQGEECDRLQEQVDLLF